MKPTKDLIKYWNNKLKESGFDDLEYWSTQGEPKEWMRTNNKLQCEDTALVSTPEQSVSASNLFDLKLDYFLAAGCLLSNPDAFQSEEHRRVWKLHSEGKSLRAIEKDPELNLSHSKAKRIIDNYAKVHFNIVTKGRIK